MRGIRFGLLALVGCGGGDVATQPDARPGHDAVPTAADGAPTEPDDAMREGSDAMPGAPDAAVGLAWQPEQLPTTADSNETSVHLAIDGTGDVMAVWRMDDGIVASRRLHAGTWSAPTKVFPVNEHADVMDLGGDAAGNVIALFATVNTSPVSLWTARYTADAGWGTPVLLEDDDGEHHTVGRAQVAVTAAGDAIAIWDQFDGTRTNVWTRRWNSGAWQPAVAAGTGHSAAVGMSSTGLAVAVWTDQGHEYAATAAPGEAWSAPVVLADAAGYGAEVAVHDNGDAVAVWEWLPPEGGLEASYASRIDGAWSAVTPLGRNAFDADLAIDRAGHAVAVWSQFDGLFWRRLDADAVRDDIADTITLDADGVPTNARIAMNDAGDLIVVWVASDRRVLAVQTTQGPSGIAVELDPGTAGESSFPDVVLAPDGAALAAWSRSKGFDAQGDRYVIVSRAYE